MNPIHSMLFSLCEAGGAGTMSIRQLSVLAKLHNEEDGRDFGEIANDLKLSRPVMSRAVGRLIKLGLVSKAVRTDDMRKVIVKLTAKGEKFCQRHFEKD